MKTENYMSKEDHTAHDKIYVSIIFASFLLRDVENLFGNEILLRDAEVSFSRFSYSRAFVVEK